MFAFAQGSNNMGIIASDYLIGTESIGLTSTVPALAILVIHNGITSSIEVRGSDGNGNVDTLFSAPFTDALGFPVFPLFQSLIITLEVGPSGWKITSSIVFDGGKNEESGTYNGPNFNSFNLLTSSPISRIRVFAQSEGLSLGPTNTLFNSITLCSGTGLVSCP